MPPVDLTTTVVHPAPWAFSFITPLMVVTVYLWRWAADRLSADHDDDPLVSLPAHRLPPAAGVGGCLALIAGWVTWFSLVQGAINRGGFQPDIGWAQNRTLIGGAGGVIAASLPQ